MNEPAIPKPPTADGAANGTANNAGTRKARRVYRRTAHPSRRTGRGAKPGERTPALASPPASRPAATLATPPAEPSASPATSNATPPDPATLANPAIERLAEDEGLRGDLTDDGWTPLQTWGFARLQAVAADAARSPQPDATMDSMTEAVRGALQSAVAAAKSGDVTDLVAAMHPPLVPDAQVAALGNALHALHLTTDPDANANAIAGVLSSSK